MLRWFSVCVRPWAPYTVIPPFLVFLRAFSGFGAATPSLPALRLRRIAVLISSVALSLRRFRLDVWTFRHFDVWTFGCGEAAPRPAVKLAPWGSVGGVGCQAGRRQRRCRSVADWCNSLFDKCLRSKPRTVLRLVRSLLPYTERPVRRSSSAGAPVCEPTKRAARRSKP